MDGQGDKLWNDLRLDVTLESMWIVSACHVQEETENITRRQTNTRRSQNAQELRRDCASTSTNNTLDQSA